MSPEFVKLLNLDVARKLVRIFEEYLMEGDTAVNTDELYAKYRAVTGDISERELSLIHYGIIALMNLTMCGFVSKDILYGGRLRHEGSLNIARVCPAGSQNCLNGEGTSCIGKGQDRFQT